MNPADKYHATRWARIQAFAMIMIWTLTMIMIPSMAVVLILMMMMTISGACRGNCCSKSSKSSLSLLNSGSLQVKPANCDDCLGLDKKLRILMMIFMMIMMLMMILCPAYRYAHVNFYTDQTVSFQVSNLFFCREFFANWL